MNALVSKLFWYDALERAIKTFAQTLVALLGAGAIDVLQVDWGQRLSVSAGAALVSVLTSIATAGATKGETASLVLEKAELKEGE